MGYKIKYKQLLREMAASGGGGGSSGATAPQSPPRESDPLPRHSLSPTADGEVAVAREPGLLPWHSPPPPADDERKIPRHDHSGQHGGRTKLYVGNIPPYAREKHLEDAFGRYGRLRQVYLQGKDYGFVVFYDPQDADAARNGLNGQEIIGRRIDVQFAREVRCYSCGIQGHSSRHCKEWKDRCFQCGEKGHLQRKCPNSPKDLRQRRSHTRSPSPQGSDQSWRYRSRSRSYSRPLSPTRGNSNAAGEELSSRGPSYSHNPRSSSPPPRKQAKPSSSFHGAIPRRDDNQNRGRNYK